MRERELEVTARNQREQLRESFVGKQERKRRKTRGGRRSGAVLRESGGTRVRITPIHHHPRILTERKHCELSFPFKFQFSFKVQIFEAF